MEAGQIFYDANNQANSYNNDEKALNFIRKFKNYKKFH